MRDLIKRRFELQQNSIKLKELKFDLGITRDKVTELVNQQKEVDRRSSILWWIYKDRR